MRTAFMACLVLALAGCGSEAAPAPSSAPATASPSASAAASAKPAASAAAGALPHLTVAATPAINSAGAYIGIDRGYFHDAGVDVEVVPFPGGAQQISSIAASQVDMGITDPGAGVFNALSRDLPMKFVADAARCTKGHCNSALLVRKALVDQGQFKDMADLGKDLKASR
jgi:NitT/TauT family transport system substrate-binding protein